MVTWFDDVILLYHNEHLSKHKVVQEQLNAFRKIMSDEEEFSWLFEEYGTLVGIPVGALDDEEGLEDPFIAAIEWEFKALDARISIRFFPSYAKSFMRVTYGPNKAILSFKDETDLRKTLSALSVHLCEKLREWERKDVLREIGIK